MRPKRILLSLLTFAVLLLATAAPAGAASEAKPLQITKVTMQTIREQRLVSTTPAKPGGPESALLEDVPYTYSQAAGHPWALSTTVQFASEEDQFGNIFPTRDAKDIVVDLPPGLLGDPQAAPRCPLAQVLAHVPCPVDTQIGVVRVHRYGKNDMGPIVNVTPEKGQSAEFGLENNLGVTVVLTAHVVRMGSTYGLTVVSNEIPMIGLNEVETTFWGVPADPSHDALRGLFCISVDPEQRPNVLELCHEGGGLTNSVGHFIGRQGPSSGLSAVPFLTMPADCAAGLLVTSVSSDSWEEPGVFVGSEATQPAATGCDLLQFNPGVEVLPDGMVADEPVGLGVNLKVPQSEGAEVSGTPELRDVGITLPEGLSISPGVVDGVRACNESGPEGINFEGPESEEVGLNGELQLAAGHCPDASIVGSAEAETPLLGGPVKGHVYLARPDCGGVGQGVCSERDAADGGLYQLYLELGGTGALADTGVNLKVRLRTEANPATGQLTTVAEGNPQLPFSELRVRLNGGPRAPLDTPSACGAATTTSDFTPWSAPGVTPEGLSVAGTPDATPSSFFDVAGCLSSPVFAPGFVSGMVTAQAGQFSAFTLNLSRVDREQFVKGIQVHTPPGLLGMLSSVPLCEEPQASAGSCSQASRIGTTTVASGAGSHPFEISGNVYLTKGYGGAPFGLSIVTNAVAGPFNLGLVVVRARIDVDPETSALTITTDETGPYAVPQIIFGVPLRLKRITVNIDRPNFMFNPTNCDAQQVTAAISGSANTIAHVSSPLAAGGCKSLAFKPTFTVTTNGHTSRAGGASLDAKVTYPAGSVGSEANIARVKVDLPKQLPSRLTTLQKACTAAQFDTNPAGCPAPSIVGIVKASTPLLPVGLEGPVYFVSHGGEAFPSLIVVLQGDGVRVDLTGSTFISKAGITSSTFKTVPDVPVNTFEIYLPEGKYSALAANGNLCTSKLAMPTEFVAQNGAVIHESTKIAVSNCAKAKKAVNKKAKPKKKNRAKKADRAGHGRGR